MQRDGESSVEEILESIKKVIARDNRESASLQRIQREQAGLRAVSAEMGADENDDVLDLGEAGEMVDEVAENGLEALVTSESRDAMRESLAALAMMAEPPARPQIVRSGETSLEGMVREMLRPMLAEWLEKNLPGMVERFVGEEIARIAGKKG